MLERMLILLDYQTKITIVYLLVLNTIKMSKTVRIRVVVV